MPLLKICGQTDPFFAAAAEAGGTDYLGFIFFAKSPRHLTDDKALAIVSALSGRAKRVGVFVNDSPEDIVRRIGLLRLDVVQLHGLYNASVAEVLRAEGVEVWKATHDIVEGTFPVDGWVIDAKPEALPGGTGKKSDWGLVAATHEAGRKAILAGGISADNLSAAASTGADILDVNSSLESSPGVKSIEKLEELLRARKMMSQNR